MKITCERSDLYIYITEKKIIIFIFTQQQDERDANSSISRLKTRHLTKIYYTTKQNKYTKNK